MGFWHWHMKNLGTSRVLQGRPMLTHPTLPFGNENDTNNTVIPYLL